MSALEVNTIFDDLDARPPKGKSGASLFVSQKRLQVTDIKEAVREKNRLNVFVDNKFFCSLDISQVVDFHLKIGKQLSEDDLPKLKRASEFGKFYSRALEYTFSRPHSSKEILDYLKKKTQTRKVRVKDRKTGEYKTVEKLGYDKSLVELVFARLEEKGYIDDQRFAELWLENRSVRKGASAKKLRMELKQKGVADDIIERCFLNSSRDDKEELRKMIAKKAKKYPDQKKLIQYLLRQGFNYSDISDELSVSEELLD